MKSSNFYNQIIKLLSLKTIFTTNFSIFKNIFIIYDNLNRAVTRNFLLGEGGTKQYWGAHQRSCQDFGSEDIHQKIIP